MQTTEPKLLKKTGRGGKTVYTLPNGTPISAYSGTLDKVADRKVGILADRNRLAELVSAAERLQVAADGFWNRVCGLLEVFSEQEMAEFKRMVEWNAVTECKQLEMHLAGHRAEELTRARKLAALISSTYMLRHMAGQILWSLLDATHPLSLRRKQPALKVIPGGRALHLTAPSGSKT
jgi:hypothetical protein